jgi:hypothetical protein
MIAVIALRLLPLPLPLTPHTSLLSKHHAEVMGMHASRAEG